MSNLTFMVCPHDTSNNPERWYVFAQYLSQRLSSHVQFQISLDFEDFHATLEKADVVYANPSNTIQLLEEKGFVAVAKPANCYDEIVLVSNHDIANPTLESLRGAKLATVRNLLPTNIALHILQTQGIKTGEIIDKDSWLNVMGSVWRNEAEFGVLYKDTYDELSEQGKGMANVFFHSDEKIAFHCFSIGPKVLDKKQEIENLLFGMNNDEKGAEVLKELNIGQWLPIDQSELDTIRRIIKDYS